MTSKIDYLNALNMELEIRALSRAEDDTEPEAYMPVVPECSGKKAGGSAGTKKDRP
jgi:hypothetical protein